LVAEKLKIKDLELLQRQVQMRTVDLIEHPISNEITEPFPSETV
jgi:hypothetical protein